MNVIKAIKHAAGVAMVAVTLTVAGPVTHAQQPSAATMSIARELITITGATALFSPLIAGVVEQAKVLFLQQDPNRKRPQRDFGQNSYRPAAAF